MSSAAAVEREIKLRVADARQGRAALGRLGAQVVAERYFEDNQLFDDRAQGLRARGAVLRLRRTPRGGLLTFKGPRQVEDGVKAREELEVAVAEADGLEAILGRLGFVPTFRYQKYREEYRHGELQIVLDETPVGTFLELEGPVEAIHAAAAALGYRRDEYLLDSYAALFFRAGGSGDMLLR